ncbi:PREDICTED: kelch domain-containing protein 3-like [Amphimedon queenslandica]|uniref:Kelch domain-containing protein 3 n=2 Tax=Amphimedon queenslandica TaxID=400682 RepID=A0A1X7T0G4_AMPQE|nr:PREDICTED: kelch domain-containing protein 3-like [Amphimedon queenslandica]|eukprot:XP_003391324.2 PREDICTED: kelch domain-containing protein 3-like [Amphimedon queenslandica]
MSEEKKEGGRTQFSMSLPRLDVRIRPPQVEPPDPVSAAEEARRRPRPPERCFFWTEYPESGFPSRVNHSTAVARNGKDGKCYVYSIGGFHASDEEKERRAKAENDPSPFNTGPIDIHCMDVETRKWAKVDVIRRTKNKDIPIRGGVPPRRYGHACVGYKDKIFMYGGRNDDDGSFRVMECFDVTRSMWLKIHATAEGCALPRSRDGHACTVKGNIMYLHGGFDTGSLVFTGDLYAFDMDSHIWTLLPPNGDRCPERDFHTATHVERKVIVFGGRSDIIAPDFSNQDIFDTAFYEYLLDELRWVKVAKPDGYQPHARRSHCAVRCGVHKILFFGGYNGGNKRHFNDVFIYDSLNRLTTEIIPFGIPPSPRRRCGYCITNNELILCGGTSPTERVYDGKKHLILHDHSDTFVLSLLPTLQQLCMMVVKELHLSTAGLPIHIRQELQNI